MKKKNSVAGLNDSAVQNAGNENELTRTIINDMFAGGFLTEGKDNLLEITSNKGKVVVKPELKNNHTESR